MIIACKQCHTRFKVPDKKVTARGLKVRCSRCGHTFRIYPDSAAERGDEPSPAATRPKGPDPFEAFGPDGTSEMEKTPARGTTVSELLAQMSPAPAEDDFEVDVAGVEPASTEPAWNFPPAPSRPSAAGAAAAVAGEGVRHEHRAPRRLVDARRVAEAGDDGQREGVFHDLHLRPAQRRVDPELVDQVVAGLPVGLERVCLTVGAVEREHLLRPEPLAQRMLGNEYL